MTVSAPPAPRRRRSRALLPTFLQIALLSTVTVAVRADGPRDNDPTSVRRVPRLGIEVSAEQRSELEAGLKKLRTAIDELRRTLPPERKSLLPDVEVFERAVRDALTYQEFFNKNDIQKGLNLLEVGQQRAAQLAAGEAPWTRQTGLVVRGYVSRLDGSVQPYGLVIPESYSFSGRSRYRCDLWFHGRGETLSEVNFLEQRMRQVGRYAPRDTIVLHPYGRYSNAFKFAGEVDVLEALDAVRGHYRIDDERTSVRGFSMGGAACWQFAVHYADRWFAANPGAGFSETPEFLRVFQNETLDPTWFEKKLWHWYDCTDWAVNLAQCPTIAYSGELDRQKQAADIMATALAKEGIDLVHIIGPQTKHSIHPDSQREIEHRMDLLARDGRRRVPRTIHFTTWTLKYPRMHWVRLNRLCEHWDRARVDAEWLPDNRVRVRAENVSHLTLRMEPGDCPFDITRPVKVDINGTLLTAPPPASDFSWECHLALSDHSGDAPKPSPAGDAQAGWKIDAGAASLTLQPGELAKRPGLQGPVDDAFMDSFLFVRPGKQCAHPQVEKWVQAELERAIVQWRQHFRGHARVKLDSEVTAEDIAGSHLILWGDPQANSVLQKIAGDLPIGWNGESVRVGERNFDAATHAPILIYPNPLNPERYVVLNSGFTYREYAYLNNARQVPMLPDWAIVDLTTPPGTRWPGKIVAADFFDEAWQLKPTRPDQR